MSDTNDLILSDFRNFLWLVWTKALNLREPSPLQYNIAFELQYGYKPSRDGLTRIQLQAARGFGKTYILCAYIVWCLLRNPDEKILLISMNTGRAKEAVRLCRQIINSLEFCHHLIPKEDQRDGADRFDVGAITRPAKDPSLAAYGIGSAVAGTHPDKIIADDTETKENALTALKRERLMTAYFEFESMIQPGGTIVHMGTPQSGNSVYNTLARDYLLKRWPCRFPDPRDEAACKNVAPWILEQVVQGHNQVGDPTYPERFGEEQLLEKLSIYGPYHFALQMMLDTSLADSNRYPLKLADLICMDAHPDQCSTNVVWGTATPVNEIKSEGFGEDRLYGPMFVEPAFLPYKMAVMWIDPSGGGDRVGYAVVKGLNGILTVLDCGGLPGGHSVATLEKLAKIANQWKIKRVVVESNFGGGREGDLDLYAKALAPVMGKINGPTAIESKRAKGQKEARILDTLEPVICSHRLVIDKKVAKNERLMYQLTHITRDRGSLAEDDEIDALAGAVAEFQDMLGLDPAKQEENRRKAAKDQVARDFLQGGQGREGWKGEAGFPSPDAQPRKPGKAKWSSSGRRWRNA